MIIPLIFLLTLEVLTFLVLKEHFRRKGKVLFYIILIFNILLSTILWLVIIRVLSFRGDFDTPSHIRDHMNLTGMIMAVAAPRVLLVLLHYTGRFARMKRGGYPRWLTSSGFIISSLIFAVFASSYAFGRYNFKTETVEVRIKGLDHRLEGLRIVQISDLHLAAFNNHYRQLQKAVDIVNGLRPDLILNTGDFISYGWKEFDRCDTILVRATSRYGNFAVLGNHDMGTYFPNATEEYKDINVAKMTELISASGYRLLDNENILLDINGAEIALIGVETEGRYPGIIHTDIEEAARGTDTARLRILLIHDPNQWRADVCGTGIEITLAGHTHGLQAGIITRKFRWSPAKYIYPEWHGLFTEGRQQLYVNRGLGYIGFPFRIWMPPEITLLILAGT